MMESTARTTILYVHSSADLYGSDRCLLDLVTRLDRKRFRPVVVLPFNGMLSEEMERAGVRVIHQDPWVLRKVLVRSGGFARYCLTLPVKVRALMRIMREEGVSLVHSNSGVALGGALAARLCGLPHIWHLREFFSGYPMLWPIHALLMGALSKRIICISNAVASQLPYIVKSKAEVVYDGIVPEKFDRGGEQTAPMEEIGMTMGGAVVGNIGRVSEIKGQDVFIRAVPEVLTVHPKARFLIVGDVFPGHEGYLRKLRSLVETLSLTSHVVFTGFRKEISSLLRNMDIVVLTTRIPEGLGLALLEAMASGKPVIGTRGGGTEEVIEDGVTGFLVPSGDFRALARAIVVLLNSGDLRARMGENGKRRVREGFFIERAASDIQKIYEGVLAEGRALTAEGSI